MMDKQVMKKKRPDKTCKSSAGIPVACLGGSAGALEPFRSFLSAMPADSGAAFVVIQHLAPAHESLLADILARCTSMKVVQVADGTQVEPNHVYVIPPNQYLRISNGILFLAKPVIEHGIRMPIDFFLRSLAEDRQECAIAILFSGTGSDGTLGVRAVRGGGGLTITQDSETAQFGDMPRNAVSTGQVDYILPPDRMPEALLTYLKQPYLQGSEPVEVLDDPGNPDGIQDILALVATRTGCDFRCYKKSTILRRIQRRMGLHHLSELAGYSQLLNQEPDEVNQLQKDLLINVTAFFRDTEAFEEFRQKAIVPLIQASKEGDLLRVWVAGCASGEEAYSVAMLLMEEMEAAHVNRIVNVFATDIDEDALQLARQGLYPASIAADVEPGRLAKFFLAKVQGFQIREPLRGAVVFASHNLISDPPFSKMDIICCRNLLIYLDTEAQAKVIPLFNFALNPSGYLFLGKAESAADREDLFTLVSKKARLFRRLTPARPIVSGAVLPGRRMMPPRPVDPPKKPAAANLGDVIRQVVLQHFAASVVLVDRKGQVLQFHGQTGKYLDMPVAEPNLNLLDIAKQGLSARLRTAMHEALSTGRSAILSSVPITREEGSPLARITIAPLMLRPEKEPILAVIFEDVAHLAAAEPGPPAAAGNETIIRQLEEALRVTEQDLQSTIQDLQASNEDLRISNEEVISTNEELQSSNEELETSKEELQSVNEELTTVNSQLQAKVEQLVVANSDIAKFLESTEVATIFLDNELGIRLFTPAANRIFKILSSDVGRPLTDFSMQLVGYDLMADVRAVAKTASAVEREVRHADGSSYLVRLVPHRTQAQQADGIVVTFTDVTQLKSNQQALIESARKYRELVENANSIIMRVTPEHTILFFNEYAQKLFGYTQEEVLGRNVVGTIVPEKDSAGRDQRAMILSITEDPDRHAVNENENVGKSGKRVWVHWSNRAVRDQHGKVREIFCVGTDITQRKEMEDEAVQYQVRLRALAERLAVSEEKARWQISRYIHDTIIQNLSLSSMRLAATQKAMAEGRTNQEADNLKETKKLVDDAISECRNVMSELTPPLLYEVGLIPAFKDLADTIQQKHGIRVNVEDGGLTAVLDETIRGLLFQSARELIMNALKHAGPCVISVVVSNTETGVQIRVQDDGRGIETGQLARHEVRQGGFGLFAIRQRLESLGGRLSIESAPGKGTTAVITLPIAKP